MITKGDDKEGNASEMKISTALTIPTTSWSTRLKDPRIVRVSRAFGGKDRHSKVCTVKGLRDRRVRLSIPTATQLYHLQDKLGLNQPSKVVEWLLKAAKNGIDELPPLQLPPGNFPQNLYPMSTSAKAHKINSTINWDDAIFEQAKSKEIIEETNTDDKNQVWTRNIGDQEKGTSFFSSSSNFMNNPMLYNPFHRWDTSLNPSLSHDDSAIRPEEFRTFNVVPVPSGSQVVVYPPAGLMQTYFTSTPEFDHPKHINSHNILSSNSQNPVSHSYTQPIEANESVRPFHFSMMSNKDNDFRSR